MNRCLLALVCSVLALAACEDQGGPTPGDLGIGAVGHYVMAVSPKAGTMQLYAVPDAPEPREVEEGRVSQGLSYSYADRPVTWITCDVADCLPPAGSVAMYTDQSLVSFYVSPTECYGVGCKTISARPSCMVTNTFCAPMQITSNLPYMLHDVVLQLVPTASAPNAVQGCMASGAKAFTNGLCGESPATAERSDGPTSNLYSPIGAGKGATDLPCSYCLGNAVAAQIAKMPGLINVVVPGKQNPQHGIQRAMAAMRLDSLSDFNIDIKVVTALATVDRAVPPTATNAGVAKSCLTSGNSTVIISGSGFGAPGICLDPTAASCPTAGAPGAGYNVVIASGPARNSQATVSSWSDSQIIVNVPKGFVDLGGRTLTVVTPFGSADTTNAPPMCGCDAFPACTGTGKVCATSTAEAICTCTGGTLTTQAAVEALATCHEISGDLALTGAAITSVATLTNLRGIAGNLTISGTQLTSLAGLERLTSVGGTVSISSNPVLSSLGGLATLATAKDPLTVTANDKLCGNSLTTLDTQVTPAACSDKTCSANCVLAAAYDFEDATGTVLTDRSGNGHNGTLPANGVTWNTSGDYGGAVLFGGTGLITIPDSDDLDLTSAMTIEAWVSPSQIVSAWRTLLAKEGTSAPVYGVHASSDTSFPAQTMTIGDTTQTVTGLAILPVNVWTHVAVTYDGATQKLYVNGLLVASRAQTGSIATSTGVLHLGGSATNTALNFRGRMDDLRIYRRALTPAEIIRDKATPVGGASDTIAPTAPVTLVATTRSATQIDVSWTFSIDTGGSGLAGYRLERCAGATCTAFTEVTAQTTLAYSNTALYAGTVYRYRVRAVDEAGNFSPYTAIVNATTSNDASLMAAYNFNEGTGATSADRAGKGNVASISSGTWVTTGKNGGAIRTTHETRASAAHSTSLNITTAITIEAWIAPTVATVGGWNNFVMKAKAYKMGENDVDTAYASPYINSFDNTISAPALTVLPVGAWTHVAMTYDGVNIKIFINGLLVVTVPRTGLMGASSEKLWLGDAPCTIDDVRIYSRALSQVEIATDMITPVP